MSLQGQTVSGLRTRLRSGELLEARISGEWSGYSELIPINALVGT